LSKGRSDAAFSFGVCAMHDVPARGTIFLRPATRDDADALVTLKHQLNLNEHRWRIVAADPMAGDLDLSREAAVGTVERDLAVMESGRGGLIIAEADGRIAGYVAFAVKEGSTSVRAETRTTLYVAGIVVDETLRNRGIGARLLAAVDAEARERGITRILLDVSVTSPAAVLYVRAGFKAISSTMMKRLE
jgi:GNAT superfamily N-acetyltransferase